MLAIDRILNKQYFRRQDKVSVWVNLIIITYPNGDKVTLINTPETLNRILNQDFYKFTIILNSKYGFELERDFVNTDNNPLRKYIVRSHNKKIISKLIMENLEK